MPRKSKIELMPYEVGAVANSLRAKGETGGLIAAEVSEEDLSISADLTPQFHASVNRIVCCVGWR